MKRKSHLKNHVTNSAASNGDVDIEADQHMITMDGRRLPHHTPASHMAPSAISLGPQRGRDDVDRMAHINPFPHNPQNQNSKILVQKSNS